MRNRRRRATLLPLPAWLETVLLSALLIGIAAAVVRAAEPLPDGRPELANPAIDVEAFLAISREAALHRASRRVSEAEFLRMSRQPGTVVLDARSREKYDELHVRGAVHLSYPDIAYASLARLLPDQNARILIYCNNNFRNAEGPFPRKAVGASLNVPTYIALYTYGYRNVYELGPLIDFEKSVLEFESAPRIPDGPRRR